MSDLANILSINTGDEYDDYIKKKDALVNHFSSLGFNQVASDLAIENILGPEPIKEAGYLTRAGRAVDLGQEELLRNVGAIGQYVGELTGYEGLEQSGKELYEEQAQAMSQMAAPYETDPEKQGFLDYTLMGLQSTIGTAPIAAAPGILAAALPATGAAGIAAGFGVSALSNMALEGGNTYAEGVASGLSDQEAVEMANEVASQQVLDPRMAALNVMQSVTPARFMPNASTLARAGVGVGQQAVTGGAEEIVQYDISKEVETGQPYDVLSDPQARSEGIVGAISSGAFGVLSAGVDPRVDEEKTGRLKNLQEELGVDVAVSDAAQEASNQARLDKLNVDVEKSRLDLILKQQQIDRNEAQLQEQLKEAEKLEGQERVRAMEDIQKGIETIEQAVKNEQGPFTLDEINAVGGEVVGKNKQGRDIYEVDGRRFVMGADQQLYPESQLEGAERGPEYETAEETQTRKAEEKQKKAEDTARERKEANEAKGIFEKQDVEEGDAFSFVGVEAGKKKRNIYERDGDQYVSQGNRYIRYQGKNPLKTEEQVAEEQAKAEEGKVKAAEGQAMVDDLLQADKKAKKEKADQAAKEKAEKDAEAKRVAKQYEEDLKLADKNRKAQEAQKIRDDKAAQKAKVAQDKEEGDAFVSEFLDDLKVADKRKAEKKAKDDAEQKLAEKAQAQAIRDQKVTDSQMERLQGTDETLNQRMDQLEGTTAPKRREQLSQSIGAIKLKRQNIVKELKKRGVDEAELEFNRTIPEPPAEQVVQETVPEEGVTPTTLTEEVAEAQEVVPGPQVAEETEVVEQEEVVEETVQPVQENVQEEQQGEVDMLDDNTRVPVEMLYPRDKDRAESLKENYPDGMNYWDYREDLNEIKEEQLYESGSNKEVDDFADQLDQRADKNFGKAFNKVFKKGPAKKAKPKVVPELTKDPSRVSQLEPPVDAVKLQEAQRLDKEDEFKQQYEIPQDSDFADIDYTNREEVLERFDEEIEGATDIVVETQLRQARANYRDGDGPMVQDEVQPISLEALEREEGSLEDFGESGATQEEIDASAAQEIDEPRSSLSSRTLPENPAQGNLTSRQNRVVMGTFRRLLPKISQKVRIGEQEVDSVVIVETQEQANEYIRQTFGENAGETFSTKKGRTEGVHVGGVTVLISDNMAGANVKETTDRMAEVLFHEEIGHRGLKGFFGERFNDFLDKFDSGVNKARINKWLRSEDGRAYVDAESRREQVEEYIVNVHAEKGARKVGLTEGLVYTIRKMFGTGQYSDTAVKKAFQAIEKDFATADAGTLMDGVLQPGQENIFGDIRFSRKPNLERDPEVVEAVKDYESGNISQDDYNKKVRERMPIRPIPKEEVEIATVDEINTALKPQQLEAGIYKKDNKVLEKIKEIGGKVAARLDIPAYSRFGTWVVSLHDGTKKGGKAIGYSQTARLTDVRFESNPKLALKVAKGPKEGGMDKSTFARMFGDFAEHDPQTLFEEAKTLMDSNEWIQVGMNPFRHSYFYDKADGNPVVAADEVIQVGALVLAKNATKTKPSDAKFKVPGTKMRFSRKVNEGVEQAKFRFSQKIQEGKIVHGQIIRDPLVLDMANIKGISKSDLRKIVAGNGPFIFMWDRMRGDGFYETPSGVRIPLQGGHANSYITYNMEAGIVGSSTSAGQVTSIVADRVRESNGYGIVGLMTAEAHGSNPTFWTIYTQVIRDLLGTSGPKREALVNKFSEIIESGPKTVRDVFEAARVSSGTKGDQRSTSVLKAILEAKTPEAKYKIFEEQGKQLTFNARGVIFKALGGVNVAKELGIPSFNKMLTDTIDPAYGPAEGQSWAAFSTARTGNGDLVQVMKFNKDKPLSTAEAEGLAAEQAHLSYDVAFIGEPVGRFATPVPLFEATEKYWKNYPKEIPDSLKLGTTIMKMPVGLGLKEKDLAKNIGEYTAEETESLVLRFSRTLDPKNSQEMRYGMQENHRTARDRITDYISRNMETFGKLPLREKYLHLRRLLKGQIYGVDKAAKALYDALAKTENPKQILDFFETRDASPSMITDPAERQAAVKAKDLINRIGKRAVGVGLLKPQQYARYKDEYLPRLYLRHILGEEGEDLARNNLRMSNMDWGKMRGDIPEAIRRLVLGQIEDPAFLAQRGIAVPGRDLAITDFLAHISTVPEWVDQSNLAEFNTLEELKTIIEDSAAGQELIQAWDLEADNRPMRVTNQYLIEEAKRLRADIAPNLQGEQKAFTERLADRMKQVAEENTADPTTLGKDFEQLPASKRYGKLAGAFVRREIFEDLTGAFKLQSGSESTMEKILGDAGIMAKAGRFFKVSKTAANLPAGHVRNFISALINAYMADVPMTRLAPGIKDMISDYKNEGPIKKIMEKYGVLGSSFAANEMAQVEVEFIEAQKRTRTDGEMNWMGTAFQWGNTWGRKGLKKIVDYYGLGDDLVKMIVIDDAINRRGMTPSEAVALAEDSIFDYSLVSSNVRYLRNAATGIPFATYLTKSVPFILKTAVNRPWKFLPFVILGNAMAEWTKSAFDWDEDDMKAARIALPEHLREKDTNLMFGNWVPASILPLPYKDEAGRLQFYDLSYVMPWGQMSQLITEFGTGEIAKGVKTLGLFGSPMANIISVIQTGIDPFSRRPIIPPGASTGEEFFGYLKYAVNLMAPPMLHTDFGVLRKSYDAATGAVDLEGDPKATVGQTLGRTFGVNITPIDPRGSRAKNIRFMERELADIKRNRNRTRKELIRNKAPSADIKEMMDDFRERIDEKRKEIQEYKKASIIKKAA